MFNSSRKFKYSFPMALALQSSPHMINHFVGFYTNKAGKEHEWLQKGRKNVPVKESENNATPIVLRPSKLPQEVQYAMWRKGWLCHS